MNSFSPILIITVVIIYFIFLSGVSFLTSRNASNETFFNADKKSPWLLVAIGMIGASLSGVTFISIPGVVGQGGTNQAFAYMQMVFGFLAGYAVIAFVLMPIYYKWKVVSIYSYLGQKLGFFSHKTAAFFFLISRVAGASLRLYLVSIVFQKFVMDSFGVPFAVTVSLTILLVWVYTFRGGIKTIVWTDTIQTVTMLLAVILTIGAILKSLNMSFGDMWSAMEGAGYTKLFFFEEGWNDGNNFFKQFFGGVLIATAMTGMDQDMMQKNLTCKSLGAAQKNIGVFSVILIFANLLFLILGGMLYIFAASKGIEIPEAKDQLYPVLALGHLPTAIGVLFVVGLIAAAYSSADSALTSLTTSFCIDFLGFESSSKDEKSKKRVRILVHVMFSVILLIFILVVKALPSDSIVNYLFRAAGYTYGPIMGLFFFAMMRKREWRGNLLEGKMGDLLVPFLAAIAITVTVVLDLNSEALFNGFTFGSVTLGLNALIMILGLFLISKKQTV